MLIEKGTPMLVVGTDATRNIRCSACALRRFGEVAPDLSEIPQKRSVAHEHGFVRVGASVPDFKRRQSGENT